MKSKDNDRVLSWENLELRIQGGSPFIQPVAGTVAIDLFFDTANRELGIRVDSLDDQLPEVELAVVNVRLISEGNRQRLEIRCSEEVLFREFYEFCIGIINSVQSDGIPVALAVDHSWEAWARLLGEEGILSQEKQRGIIAELWFLIQIAEMSGWSLAVSSWHDEANAEHDFCLGSFDVEVKSTISEKRIHMIGSEGQLMNSVGRQLFLVSIQLTSATSSAIGAFSLTSLVERVEKQLDTFLLHAFKQRLEKIGWKASHRRHYEKTYVLRTPPSLCQVSDAFPRITRPHLQSGKVPGIDRILDIAYRIEITGLGIEFGTTDFQSALQRFMMGSQKSE